MPHCNDAGLGIIRSDEGLSLRAFPDCASPLATTGSGSGDPWTIGYGRTAGVHPGEVITLAQAIAFLRGDVGNAESAVAHAAEVVLTPNQFSALVSFEYNTGAFARGEPIVGFINARDFPAAIIHLNRYIYAQGQVMPGLITRRAAEAALFGTPG